MMTETDTDTTNEPFGNNMQSMAFAREESRRQLNEAQVEIVKNWKPPVNPQHGVEYMLYCQWCLLPFPSMLKKSGKFRDSIEYEPLRRLLLVTDPNWEPPICDNCFPAVMGSARAHSNMADKPEHLTNFLLRVQEALKEKPAE